MKILSADGFVARLLGRLARAVIHRPRWFFYPQVVLFFVCIVYTIKYLQFDTSRNDLVGANKKYHQNFLKFKKEFPTQDDLVVVVESDNEGKNRQFVERLGAKLEAETNLFTDVFYKGDLKMLGPKALLFLPEADLVEFRKKIHEFRPFIEPFARTTNLVTLFEMVNKQFASAKPEQNEQTDSLVQALPAITRIVNEAADSLRRPGVPPSPGVTALFSPEGEAAQQEYIRFDRGRIYLVTAQAPAPRALKEDASKASWLQRWWKSFRYEEKAAEEDLTGRSVERLRRLVEETKAEVPGLNVGITGEPVLELDEMSQSQTDSLVASVVSLILCALIFIYGYQETGRPVKATICLIVGIAYTMAFTTATVGHLNILTITFVPILIGLAIDFGVHLVTRYEEELRHGKTNADALTKALVFTGQGIFTGCFTTAGAFLAMGFTDFKGIQEMGIICGGGLLVCLVPMLTLLPVLLLRGRQNVLDHDHVGVDHRERIENLWLRRPVMVVVATAITCALAASQLGRVFFDYNLLNMQSAGLPAVEFEEKLIRTATAGGDTNSNGRSVLFAAVIADSAGDVVKLEEKIRRLTNTVAEVDSIARFTTGDEARKLALIGEIKRDLADIRFAEPDPRPANVPELSRTLYSLNGYVGLGRDQAQPESPEVARQLTGLRKAIEGLRWEMFQGSPAEQATRAAKLGEFQRALFGDLGGTFDALREQDDREGLRIEDLPPALRHRFVGRTGKQLLQVYPKKNVWQRANQEEFVRELRQALDPNGTDLPVITGTPVQLYEYTRLLKRSYEEAALYSLAAIVVLVLIHFRSLGSVVLALLPVAIGSVWLGGLMGWWGIPLNPANIMTLPLIIGIGVTNGIHILNRFAEEQTPSILAKSTGKAVLVSGLTTIAGFGSLALAKHRGIESLGYVMATGVATCMFAGLTCLPALLNLTTRRKNLATKQPSADNARSTLGREEPR
ncbi:MAG: RND transporter [Pedosphaera sp.]|nr:RND transporter [Pedosphaera sp.]